MFTDRRRFLQLVASGAFGAAFNASIKRALAIPAHRCTGTIADVEHIVILMQENRSFDHYFGTLRGVRGFGDPRAVKLPSGDPVFAQPDGSGGKVLPFHPPAADLGLQFLEDLPHNWSDTHQAWHGGKYDQWVPAKSATTMAYLTRNDIPYHYALADAFTVCDAYHCSFLGATDPNRYHMWTGWVGNDGSGGGPVLNNAEAGYGWSTYPERLTRNGISWKIYQDAGAGLDADHYWGWGEDAYVGNYGDNSLLYFHQYQNALPGSPLYVGARTATNVGQEGSFVDLFRADVLADRLPQVSWIVAPEAFSEHGNWPTNYGAWYIAQFLDALTANPEVYGKTALFLMYDENDGFFDHMVPPTPPQSRAEGLSTVDTKNEVFAGNADFPAGPFGLGVRVPMLVISPWSKGGWVSSELFDHTSLIRFIERRFGGGNPDLIEANITAWRRAVTGDLTAVFNFERPDDDVVALPPTAAYAPPDRVRHPDYHPVPPSLQSLPVQEPGVRPARAVPYELYATSDVDPSTGTVTLSFANRGRAAAVFQVRSGAGQDGPWTYTVGAGDRLQDTWKHTDEDAYDLYLHGPNGFMRSWKGSLAGRHRANLSVAAVYLPQHPAVSLVIQNHSTSAAKVRLFDGYAREWMVLSLPPGEQTERRLSVARSFGWYDFVIGVEADPAFQVRVAGHVETGRDSMSDPALGG